MKNWPDRRCAWLALYLTPGLGNIACRNLLEVFGEPEAIFRCDLRDLTRVAGVREKAARNLLAGKFALDPEEELRKTEESGAWILAYTDPSYPSVLKEIHDPPVLLYVKGKKIPPELTFVAIVGSRNATHYGVKAAEQLGEGLARKGVGVASGLARGIDSAAHWGCLRGGGFTIAVLGTGIDVLYPAANKKLSERISEQGTIISEFPLGTPPEPRNFPIRNRIISGLSRGVVVVEATKRSGSLITASFALEHGREVFAVPGSIDSFKSMGTHSLIKQGANLIENAEDIIEDLGYAHGRSSKEPMESSRPPLLEMDDSEKRMYEIIVDYPIHIDQIVRRLGLDPGEALSTLMRMELKGVVKQLPGKMFMR